MKIIEVKEIERLYTRGLKRTKKPVEIVVHGTAGGSSAQGLIKWMTGLINSKDKWEKQRAADYLKGVALFHFVIDYDGTIYQLINPDNFVYHSQAGLYDSNTIGVELMNSKPKNAGTYTAEQYKALAELIEYLKRHRFPLITRISTHDFNAWTYSGLKKTTPCPGPNFRFTELKAALQIPAEETDYGLII